MRTASHIYWLLWFAIGFGLAEVFAIYHPCFDTLTSTWKWLSDSLPLPLSLVLSGALSAALLWLLTVHWIWRGLDLPDFDGREALIVLVGFLLGVAGALITRRRRRVD